MKTISYNLAFTTVGNASFDEGKTFCAKVLFKDTEFYTRSVQGEDSLYIICNKPVRTWDRLMYPRAKCPSGNDSALESVISFLYNKSSDLNMVQSFVGSDLIISGYGDCVWEIDGSTNWGRWFDDIRKGVTMRFCDTDKTIEMNNGEVVVEDGVVEYVVVMNDDSDEDNPKIESKTFDNYNDAKAEFVKVYTELKAESEKNAK